MSWSRPFCFSLLALFAGTIFAQEAPENPVQDRSSFNIISERNIFDPNRSARVAREEERGEPAREPVVQFFSLIGTMSYEKGKFAFFGGSGSEFKKVLKPADSIAGFTITEIGASQVKLEKEGETVDLRVGMAMERQDEGEWQMTANGARAQATSSTPNKNATAPATQAEAGPSAEESDILKRLLERRQQEMQK